MFERALLSLLNHLLAGESWARARLQPFSEQIVEIRGPALRAIFSVNAEGLLVRTIEEAPAQVTIVLSDDAPWLWLSDRSAVMAKAQLSGRAEFCEALAFVFRNLRWDAEADLAKLFGDIPARRISQIAQAGLRWQVDASRRVGSNVAEYLREERALLVPRQRLQRQRAQIAELSDGVDALERRLRGLQ